MVRIEIGSEGSETAALLREESARVDDVTSKIGVAKVVSVKILNLALKFNAYLSLHQQ